MPPATQRRAANHQNQREDGGWTMEDEGSRIDRLTFESGKSFAIVRGFDTRARNVNHFLRISILEELDVTARSSILDPRSSTTSKPRRKNKMEAETQNAWSMSISAAVDL